MSPRPTRKPANTNRRLPQGTGLTETDKHSLVPIDGQTPNPRETPHTPLAVLQDRWHQTDTIPVIEIHWIDAISTGDDWQTEQDLDTKPAPSIALGYLIAETPHTITITALINAAHHANGITIPKGCITTIRTLTQ